MNYLLAIVSGFASGVFLRSLFYVSWTLPVFILLLAAILITAPRLLEGQPRPAYLLGALFFLFVALGIARAAIADTPLPDTFARDLRHRVSYHATVVGDPDLRDANQRVLLRVETSGATTLMLAVAPRFPSVSVGDQVYVSGTLAVPQPFASEGGRVFRYDKYLQRGGVRFILNFAYLRVESSAPWYSVSAALARIKHLFLSGLQATLPEPYASLASGVVIGGKSGLGADLQQAFVTSGLVQIIVLSGYNVMIVAEWVMAGLALFALSRRSRALAGALALILFVATAGFSSTAVRAMIMALIALFARATARTYAASRALLFVILVMLIWNPLYLVFDPGFGLSVAATAGLIWLAPIIERWLGVSFWKNILATTLAAQIAVLPLLLYDTGNLSLVAIPANLITMPVVPLTMALSALAGLAGVLFSSFAPMLGTLLSFPAYLLNAYLIFIAQNAAALPLAAFILPAFPFWLVLAAYAGLIYFASSKRFSMTDQLSAARKASI